MFPVVLSVYCLPFVVNKDDYRWQMADTRVRLMTIKHAVKAAMRRLGYRREQAKWSSMMFLLPRRSLSVPRPPGDFE